MSPTSSPERFDALRAAHPDLGFALYAFDPRGVVTLEVMTPDGETFSFRDLTADAAMAQAFPLESVPTDRPEAATPEPPEPPASIFD